MTNANKAVALPLDCSCHKGFFTGFRCEGNGYMYCLHDFFNLTSLHGVTVGLLMKWLMPTLRIQIGLSNIEGLAVERLFFYFKGTISRYIFLFIIQQPFLGSDPPPPQSPVHVHVYVMSMPMPGVNVHVQAPEVGVPLISSANR